MPIPTRREKFIRYINDYGANQVRREYVLFFDVDYEQVVLLGGIADGKEMIVAKDTKVIYEYDPIEFNSIANAEYTRVANTRAFYYRRTLPQVESKTDKPAEGIGGFVRFIAILVLASCE